MHYDYARMTYIRQYSEGSSCTHFILLSNNMRGGSLHVYVQITQNNFEFHLYVVERGTFVRLSKKGLGLKTKKTSECHPL